MTSKILVLALFLSLPLSAWCQSQPWRHDSARWEMLLQACENSEYNVNGITLPRHTPGQRPSFTDAQKQLLDDCRQAGILPPHHHHHHQDGQAQNTGAN
jgi:hypothetical protein